MKFLFLVLSITFGILQPAQARWYGGTAMAHLSADFRNVDTGSSQVPVKGSLELIGFQGGWENTSAGNLGADFSLGILGVNSQKLEPDPNWGIPWFFRVTGKMTYMTSGGLFGFFGADIIGNLYSAEYQYFGPGVVFGVGVRIKDRVSVALGATNNSILFAVDPRKRFLRGSVFEINFLF